MYRRFTSSLHKRINSQNFKCNPYFLHKNTNKINVCNQYGNDSTCGFNLQISSHPSVILHPLIKYSLVSNKFLTNLNDIQESSYLSIVSGKDVTIHSPIGTGKTIAYLLPIINNVYYIHDVLEKLVYRNEARLSESDFKVRNLAVGWNNKLGHSLLPTSIDNHAQDLENLESYGKNLFETYKGGTTIDKLLEVLYLNEPRNLRLMNLPVVPMKTWKRRCKNSIYRKIMTNPLGSVRCTVILVPNKDLVSQIVSYIRKIDILGRVSVQTLTNVQYETDNQCYHLSTRDNCDSVSKGSKLVGEKSNSDGIERGLNEIDNANILYEDELKMIENIQIKQLDDKEVETVALNMGNRVNRIKMKYALNNNYAIDGIVPESVNYKKTPVIASDSIQWGCVDVVVCTVQGFAFELMKSGTKGIYPVCVVFDEVDMLFENNANRSSIFEIISKLRPRPPSYNPLVHFRKRSSRPPPPVQIVNVGSTINFGGFQTCGSMIYDRFSTSKLVFSEHNHVINSDLNFEKADPDSKLDALVKLIVNNPVNKTIVYCNSLRNCKIIYDTLREHDWPVMSFHSRSALSTRLAILEAFRDGEPRILVATDLVTRGINLEVDHVINYDFPTSSSVFYHRIKSQSAKVTSIVTTDSELCSQIVHFSASKKPISSILSRKRSLRKKLDKLKVERVQRTETRLSNVENGSNNRSFLSSQFQIGSSVEGDVKYRTVTAKMRMASMLNNYT